MAIAEDASTPAVVPQSGQGTIVTASFTPPANSLLVAIGCVGDNSGTTGFPQTMAFTDSTSGTWTNPASYGATSITSSNGGAVRISYRYLTVSPGAMTVTGTANTFGSTGGGTYLAVRVLTGANPVQTGAAAIGQANTTATTAASVTITPTQIGSWIYGGVEDPDTAATFTVNGLTTLAGTPFVNSTDRVTSASWFMTTPSTDTVTAQTLGGTLSVSNRSNLAALEILPAAAAAATQPPLRNRVRFMASNW